MKKNTVKVQIPTNKRSGSLTPTDAEHEDDDRTPFLQDLPSTPSKHGTQKIDSNNTYYGKTESHEYDHEESDMWRENLKQR